MSCISQGIFGQNLTLKIKGENSKETAILNNLIFKKEHASKEELLKEINAIQKSIQYLGYFTSTLVKVETEEKVYTAYFDLGVLTKKTILIIPKSLQSRIHEKKDSVVLKTKELQSYMTSLIKLFDKEGASFTEIKLENPEIKNETLYLQVSFNDSTIRKINKVIVKGYESFPDSFIKNYLEIDHQNNFSSNQLDDISSKTKGLSFVKQIKPPQVLFSKDSTLLFLYLEKNNSNSIDGLINLASKENGDGLLINGYLDLKLNNALNTGEEFNLIWNRVDEEKTEFNLTANIPYIFNSKFSLETSFNLYRQDSTFVNTDFKSTVNFQLNSNSTFGLSYSNINSNYTNDSNPLNFDSFSLNSFGLKHKLSINSNSLLYNKNFELKTGLSIGNRKSETTSSSNQFRIEFEPTINIAISEKGYIYLKNRTEALVSDNYLINEFYRIGGANTIRGFNEQSIFTNRYSYFNLEYRYLTSQTSYLYTITDLGFFENFDRNQINTLLALGGGYSFPINNSLVSIGYALGTNVNDNFVFKNSKLIINWVSFF